MSGHYRESDEWKKSEAEPPRIEPQTPLTTDEILDGILPSGLKDIHEWEVPESGWEDFEVPREERPHVEYLAAFSTPARMVSMERMGSDGMEPPRVVYKATPRELEAHVQARIMWAIDRKLKQGKLTRPKGGEDVRTDCGDSPQERCDFCQQKSPGKTVSLDVRRHEREPEACLPCYQYLLGSLEIDHGTIQSRCDVCSDPAKHRGTRFSLCDACWEDIGRGRRVLVEDGKLRTIPTEFREGSVRTFPWGEPDGGDVDE